MSADDPVTRRLKSNLSDEARAINRRITHIKADPGHWDLMTETEKAILTACQSALKDISRRNSR
jgi:hypothetical protein